MPPLPVTILGGYLGAGKTTLVNHVLRHADGRRIAVLVNDFGTLPIDTDMIEGSDGGVLSIAGGCVCCSYGDDLVAALISIARRTPRPDYVLLETSGVALPGSIARSLALLFDYSLGAILVMADAETTPDRLSDRYMGDTLHRQFAAADLIVVNKCDLVPADNAAALCTSLGSRFAQARVVTSTFGALSLDIVFEPTMASPRQQRDRPGAKVSTPEARGQSQHHQASVSFAGGIEIATLQAGLDGFGLVRAKGVVRDRAGTHHVVQYAGRRWSLVPVSEPPGHRSRFVCISVGAPIESAALVTLLARCGAVDIDLHD